jgi:hypothetical protein
MRRLRRFPVWACLVLAGVAASPGDNLRVESFDRDPGWDGLNNRSEGVPLREIEQDFGYAADRRLGESPGAIGGLVTPDGTPAYYAKPLPALDFDTPFSASGTLHVEKGAGNTLLGFFNAETINEWRTPNTVVFRIYGRGDTFHVHIEYATSKWRAGAGIIGRYDKEADRMHPVEIPAGGVHTWSLAYDPAGGNGRGAVTATFDDYREVFELTEGHKADGAAFNRFGILNVVKHCDSPGRLWIGDLVINGERQDLSADPRWDARNNRVRYESDNVRPRFNFGYSPTRFAGGAAAGEIGGLFFRGDCRYPEKLAYYGAPVESLSLEKPLRASGRFALRRAMTDSTTLFGFFHSKHSVEVNPSQAHGLPRDMLGFNIEGPSSQGFNVYPVCRSHGDDEQSLRTDASPLVYPDGAPHDWSLDYRPATADAPAVLALTVDGKTVEMPLDPDLIETGATFDRFGFVTPWIDGNGQVVYFDDLSFTVRQ